MEIIVAGDEMRRSGMEIIVAGDEMRRSGMEMRRSDMEMRRSDKDLLVDLNDDAWNDDEQNDDGWSDFNPANDDTRRFIPADDGMRRFIGEDLEMIESADEIMGDMMRRSGKDLEGIENMVSRKTLLLDPREMRNFFPYSAMTPSLPFAKLKDDEMVKPLQLEFFHNSEMEEIGQEPSDKLLSLRAAHGCKSEKPKTNSKEVIIGDKMRLSSKEVSGEGKESEEPKAAVVSTLLVLEDDACEICGKKDHGAYRCPFKSSVPVGSCVGPGYVVICKGCGHELVQPVGACPWLCRSPGHATHKSCFICKTFAHHMPSECPFSEAAPSEPVPEPKPPKTIYQSPYFSKMVSWTNKL